MSSRYDPSFEDFLLEYFDIGAASDDTGVADCKLSLDAIPGKTHHDDMQNGNGLFEETHRYLSYPPDRRNEFQATEITDGFDQGNYVGFQHTLDNSAVFGGVTPAASSAGATHNSELGGGNWPIEVSFFFRSTLTGRSFSFLPLAPNGTALGAAPHPSARIGKPTFILTPI